MTLTAPTAQAQALTLPTHGPPHPGPRPDPAGPTRPSSQRASEADPPQFIQQSRPPCVAGFQGNHEIRHRLSAALRCLR